MILEHYAHSDATDKPALLLIVSIIEQIESFITEPEFKSLVKETCIDDSACLQQEDSPGFVRRLIAGLRACIGPTQREMLLSRQRQELLERAERAESMAFQALAETAEIGRERDAIVKKLQQQAAEPDAKPAD